MSQLSWWESVSESFWIVGSSGFRRAPWWWPGIPVQFFPQLWNALHFEPTNKWLAGYPGSIYSQISDTQESLNYAWFLEGREEAHGCQDFHVHFHEAQVRGLGGAPFTKAVSTAQPSASAHMFSFQSYFIPNESCRFYWRLFTRCVVNIHDLCLSKLHF